MGAPAIVADGVSKRFDATAALDNFALTVPSGGICALLGPNGAGKTTFVSMVATLLRPDSGIITVYGIDVAADPGRVRRRIGLAGQHAAVEPALTGRENVRMIARLYGFGRSEAAVAASGLLEELGLEEVADRPVSTYSGGERRRLDLGATLVGRPSLLLLDEPTTGLDPRSRQQLWSVVRDLARSGTDVLLTTQYLEEADRLADRIAIVDHGRVVASGTAAELKSATGGDVIEATARHAGDVDAVVRAIATAASALPQVDVARSSVTAPVEDGPAALAAVVAALGGIELADLGLRRPSLDEVFLRLTAPAGVGGSTG
jgi:ABC-2 type transport system ATP-binding protein